MRVAPLLAALLLTAQPVAAQEDAVVSTPLQRIVAELRTRHPEVMRRAEDHRLQIRLAVCERALDGRPQLSVESYRVDADYFYPASSVKLLAALAAMERLHEIAAETKAPVGLDTPLVYHPLFDDEELDKDDPSNLDGGAITVGHELAKLFIVSDNRAYNRLYELVGQRSLNERAWRAGFPAVRIRHRLSEFRSEADNRRFPAIDLLVGERKIEIPQRSDPVPLPAPQRPIARLRVGSAHVASDTQVDGPMDFSTKNWISLNDLQEIMVSVVAPEYLPQRPGFRLTPADREFLLRVMRLLPRESRNPVYDPSKFPDDYGRFFLPGVARVVPADEVVIWDKIGVAYGFTTENACILHRPSGRMFFLAATIYTNSDGVVNDGAYDYATVGFPFMADLGELAARAIWGR